MMLMLSLRQLMIVVNYSILNKISVWVNEGCRIFQIPANIEVTDDDVEQTVLGEEDKVELDRRELDREEKEEYIEEETGEDKQMEEDSSHKQSSVVMKLTKICSAHQM